MRDVRFLTAIDDIDVQEGRHFVVIVMGGLVDGQQPIVCPTRLVSRRGSQVCVLIDKKAYGTGKV